MRISYCIKMIIFLFILSKLLCIHTYIYVIWKIHISEQSTPVFYSDLKDKDKDKYNYRCRFRLAKKIHSDHHNQLTDHDFVEPRHLVLEASSNFTLSKSMEYLTPQGETIGED